MWGLFGSRDNRIREMLQAGAMAIDVRSPQEYEQGNAPVTSNIPLDAIRDHIEDIKREGKPVLLCCATGVRSGVAANILRNHGIEAFNAGSWKKVSALSS